MTLTRLPARPADRLERRREVRGGALAALGLLVVLVGVPLALLAAVGNPLPTTAPNRDWLTAPVTATAVLRVLALALWVAWAHFAVCVLAEWRAARRGTGLPGEVPFGGGSQLLARRLVAATLLLAGAATFAPQASVAGPAPAPAAVVSVQASAAPTEVAVEAAPVLRAGNERTYSVQPPEGRRYDCLWDIAERTLGDPLRYKEIFELNKDKVQPDGRRLVDADLIRPGWVLTMPADATGPGVSAPALAPPSAVEVTTAVAAPDEAPVAAAEVAAPESGELSAPRALTGAGLLAAGLLVAVGRRRGPYGTTPDAPALDALRRAARPERAGLLDRALRTLADACAVAGRPLPEIALAYVDEQHVTLSLVGAAGEPPAPWAPVSDGRGWKVLAADLPPLAPDTAAPYPALAGVALTAGTDVLVDLEAAPGLVSLEGEGTPARELAVSLAVELATNRWSDGVRVDLVGFGDDLTGLAPAALTSTDDLGELLVELEQERGAGAPAGGDVLSGRLVRDAARPRPRVLVLSGPPAPAAAARLHALVADRRTPLAVVAVGATPSARWRFTLDAAGTVDLGVLGVRGQARRLAAQDYVQVLEALTQVDQERVEGSRDVATLAPRAALELLPEPVRPRAAGPAAVEVRLLGEVEVLAPGPVEPARRALLTDLVVAVALHPAGLHEAVLRAEVWPRGVEEDVVARTVAQAQSWLGTGADGRPRLRRDEAGRYVLAGDVAVDWEDLQRAAAVPEGAAQGPALEAALGLFRGEALHGARTDSMMLALTGRDARRVGTAVARRAAALAVQRGDRPAAATLLRRGLVLVPASDVLWRELLRVSDPGDAPQVAAQAYAALAARGLPPEPETDALVAELAPQVARPA